MGMPLALSTQEWRASQDDRPQQDGRACARLVARHTKSGDHHYRRRTCGSLELLTGCHTRLPIHWQREHLANLRTAMPYRKRRKIAAIKTSNDAQSRQHCLWTMRGPTRDVADRRIQGSRIRPAITPAPPLRPPAQDETSSWHR